MSNPSTIALQLAAAAATGIATAQAVSGATPLTLNGSLVTSGVAVMDVARRIIIASSGADSAIIFTVKGTDRNGNSQSETITGVATPTPVQSVLDYKTVTSITPSGATAGNISAGTNGVGSTQWIVDNFLARFWALTVAISAAAGVTYSLETTYDDPNKIGPSLTPAPQQFSMNGNSAVPPHVFTLTTTVGLTLDNQITFPDQPIFAHRLTVTAGTGQAIMWSIQAGID